MIKLRCFFTFVFCFIQLSISANATTDESNRPPLRTRNQFNDDNPPALLVTLPDPKRNQTIVVGSETYLGRSAPDADSPKGYGIYAIDNANGKVKSWRPYVFESLAGTTVKLHQNIILRRTKAVILDDSVYISTNYLLKDKFYSQIYRVHLNDEKFETILNAADFDFITEMRVYKDQLLFSFQKYDAGGMGTYDPISATVKFTEMQQPTSQIQSFVVIDDVAVACVTDKGTYDSVLRSIDIPSGQYSSFPAPQLAKGQSCAEMEKWNNGVIVYVYGDSFRENQLLLWSPEKQMEKYLSNMPGIWNMRVAGNNLYLAGDDNIHIFDSEVLRVNLDNYEWKYLKNSDGTRLYVSGIVGQVDTEIYVIGNFTLEDGSYSNIMRVPDF